MYLHIFVNKIKYLNNYSFKMFAVIKINCKFVQNFQKNQYIYGKENINFKF